MNTQNRNDVLAFWHAIYQASQGFEDRPMWKAGGTADFYAPDHSMPYSYTFSTTTPAPAMLKSNGVHASGELNLNFVKDVERRVNFFRALTGVPAAVSLMDSDTQKNSSTIQPTNNSNFASFEPPLTTLKADAAQRSAYLISRTYNDRFADGSGTHGWGTYHNQTIQIINAVRAWNKPAWNGNRYSNLALGFYGPAAIDQYLMEDVAGPDAENREVGHRRFVLASSHTNFATGDIPGSYVPGASDGAGNPKVRPSTNALYVVQRPAEKATNLTARYTSYPSAGFFPAPVNTPYWSLSHPNAVFSVATMVSMTTAAGTPVAVGTKIVGTGTNEPTIAWEVLNTDAIARSITADRTYQVTVSNFTVSGSPATYSYSVTLINPDRIATHPAMTGSTAPPAGGAATYFFQAASGAEAVQINAFDETPATWVENAEGAASASISADVHPSYALFSNSLAVSGNYAFRLTHPVRYSVKAGGVPEQSFEITRDILPSSNGNSLLRFGYRRGYMTESSSLVVEKSADEGASWAQIATIAGKPQLTIDATSSSADVPLAPSPSPLRIRFRFYKSGTGSTYNHQDYQSQPTGIFIDNITTTNCRTLELRNVNELSPAADRLTINNITAGGSLDSGDTIHLRMRSKLGGHWFQYGASKILSPTATPLTGFNGWTSYDYPVLANGFAGDDDGDGVPNVIEFAFYGDPLQPASMTDIVSVDPGNALARDGTVPSLSIRRQISGPRTGLDYEAEWSDTLAPGSWSQQGVTVKFTDGWMIASVPKGPAARFLRWKFVE